MAEKEPGELPRKSNQGMFHDCQDRFNMFSSLGFPKKQMNLRQARKNCLDRFKCEICERNGKMADFAYKSGLTLHMQREHELKNASFALATMNETKKRVAAREKERRAKCLMPKRPGPATMALLRLNKSNDPPVETVSSDQPGCSKESVPKLSFLQRVLPTKQDKMMRLNKFNPSQWETLKKLGEESKKKRDETEMNKNFVGAAERIPPPTKPFNLEDMIDNKLREKRIGKVNFDNRKKKEDAYKAQQAKIHHQNAMIYLCARENKRAIEIAEREERGRGENLTDQFAGMRMRFEPTAGPSKPAPVTRVMKTTIEQLPDSDSD